MKSLSLIVSLLIISSNLFGANYYCDPINGNMSNNGSSASPWTTLEAVFNQGITFTGGDKIFLLNGNHGFPKISGTNSSNVEITPLSGHSPMIERVRIGNVANASYWYLNGLTIQSENVAQYPINLIDIYANSTNITVNNCTITSNLITASWNRADWRAKTNNGVLAKGSQHTFTNNTIKNISIGITLDSDNSTFTNNTIQYFSIDGIRGLGNNCSYIGNSILDNISVYYYNENHYDGFQSYSCCPAGSSTVSNVIIRGNTIINCTDNTRQFRGSMQGIGCFDGMYNNWVIENNVIIIDNWHGITLSGAINCKIANNTIIDPYDVTYQDPNDPTQHGNVGPAYIRISNHKNGTLSSGNNIFNNLVPTLFIVSGSSTLSNNILLGASTNYPNFFVNYNAYDLHLISSSTAIDAGTNTNAPSIDIENNNRPQGSSTDVGAYEFGSCNTNFTITPPAQTSICAGDAITLTTDANTTATWDNGVTDNVPFNPATTQTYTATVGTGNCTTTKQITISVSSVPSFTPSADQVSVCQGDAITLTTNSSTTATWNYGVVDNVAFIPPHPQTYTATVTNGNCSHSEQIAINVSAIPSLSINASNVTICQGETVTLNASTDGMNLSWDNGVQNNTPFIPQSTQTYTATANNFGCSVSETTTIVVTNTPSFNIISNQTSICSGDAVTLTTDANSTAIWDNGITDNTPFSPNNSQTYTATVTNSGCSHSEQIQINVSPLPNLSINASNTSICEGSTVTLNATTNAPNLSWNNNVQNNISFSPTSTQTYTATATNGSCSITEDITVTVIQNPTFNIIASQNIICQGEPLTLTTDASLTATWTNNVIDNVAFNPTTSQTYTATITNGNCTHNEQITINVEQTPSLSYTVWDSILCEGEPTSVNGSSDIGTISWNNGVQNAIPFTPTISNYYIVEANYNTCITKDSVFITVNSIPSINIVQNGNILTASNSNGNLQWYLNGSPISGANSINYTAVSNGDYTASIIDNNECTETSNTITIQDVSISENYKLNFLISPNPAKNTLQITTSLNFSSIEILSIEGKLIMTSFNKNLDISNLTSGVYLVKLTTKDGSGIKRVIVE